MDVELRKSKAEEDGKSNLNDGQIAGIIIGVLLLIGVILVTVVHVKDYFQAKQEKKKLPTLKK